MDETTHAFSRKVLDRANTLDFDAAPVLLDGQTEAKGLLSVNDAVAVTSIQRQALFLRARITSIGRARERLSQINPAFSGQALALLQAVNDKLYVHRLHFAYRVRDDILAYLANSFDSESGQGLLLPDPQENFTLGLDLQFLQKILPKLNGLAEVLDHLLQELQAWSEAQGLPRTAAKIERMRTHGMVTGYIRFYE